MHIFLIINTDDDDTSRKKSGNFGKLIFWMCGRGMGNIFCE
jgi:hypothetical protein